MCAKGSMCVDPHGSAGADPATTRCAPPLPARTTTLQLELNPPSARDSWMSFTSEHIKVAPETAGSVGTNCGVKMCQAMPIAMLVLHYTKRLAAYPCMSLISFHLLLTYI